MKDRKRELLTALADGKFHSGESLAAALQLSRAAVWKHINTMREQGLDVSSLRGKGYRLLQPVELFDKGLIYAHLDEHVKRKLTALDVMFEINSTNLYLLDKLKSGSVHAHAVVSEFQTEGKGRGDNRWLSPPASGICLSFGWCFDSTPSSLTALSLATGVAVAEALTEAGCPGIKLKWPNDIVADGAKLGGILIESHGQAAGKCDVVIGVGINVCMPVKITAAIDQKVTDLFRLMQCQPSRNLLAAIILRRLIDTLDRFTGEGFSAFIDKWRKLDFVRDKNAVLLLAHDQIPGRVMGIDDNGLLVLNVNGENRKFSSGELSLRLVN